MHTQQEDAQKFVASPLLLADSNLRYRPFYLSGWTNTLLTNHFVLNHLLSVVTEPSELT